MYRVPPPSLFFAAAFHAVCFVFLYIVPRLEEMGVPKEDFAQIVGELLTLCQKLDSISIQFGSIFLKYLDVICQHNLATQFLDFTESLYTCSHDRSRKPSKISNETLKHGYRTAL